MYSKNVPTLGTKDNLANFDPPAAKTYGKMVSSTIYHRLYGKIVLNLVLFGIFKIIFSILSGECR